MSRRTDGEKIDELEKTVAVLTERVDTLREQFKILADVSVRLALVDQHVSEMKKGQESRGNRFWSLVPPLVAGLLGAIVGSVLTHFLALSRWRRSSLGTGARTEYADGTAAERSWRWTLGRFLPESFQR